MGRIAILAIRKTLPVLMLCLLTVSCNSAETDDIPPFDSARAYSHIERQVSFGPRIPGTDSHAETMEWIVARLQEHTSHVSVGTFSGIFAGNQADMSNIMASFSPEKSERVLLCAHWDSRPQADRDPDPAKRTQPVPGANDGASGVAVLLEIAAAIGATPPPVGVDIVFFDGEDGGSYGDTDSWILGSQHFAKSMPATYRPKYAVLLDMIGDSDLTLSRDTTSMYAAPELWARITGLCKSIGIPLSSDTMSVIDDHVPLIERGIPSVDLIDFDYPSWHTTADTPDKCSEESLDKIGRLVLSLLYSR